MTAPVAFIDTETLGLDPDIHPVWEVAVISGDVECVWQLPVTEVDVERAHPMALEMTHFRRRRVATVDLPPRAHVLRQVAQATAGCHLVGAVPSFDEERLRREMRANGIVPTWHYHLIDVETLAIGWLAREKGVGSATVREDGGSIAPFYDPRPPWDSRAVSRALGVDLDQFGEAHTALADARWAKALYEVVMGGG